MWKSWATSVALSTLLFASQVSGQVNELITDMPQQPAQRSGAASATVDSNTLVLFGGLLSTGEATNDLWEYKINLDMWTRLHNGDDNNGDDHIPNPRIGHSAVFLRDQVVVFGGYNSEQGDMNDLWSFHRQWENWTELTPMGSKPSQRNGHSAFAPHANSSVMFVFGGNMKNDQWKFDFDENVWMRVRNDTLSNGVEKLVFTGPLLLIALVHLLFL